MTELETKFEHFKCNILGPCKVRRHGEQVIDLQLKHKFYYAGEEMVKDAGFLLHKSQKHRTSFCTNIESYRKYNLDPFMLHLD